MIFADYIIFLHVFLEIFFIVRNIALKIIYTKFLDLSFAQCSSATFTTSKEIEGEKREDTKLNKFVKF